MDGLRNIAAVRARTMLLSGAVHPSLFRVDVGTDIADLIFPKSLRLTSGQTRQLYETMIASEARVSISTLRIGLNPAERYPQFTQFGSVKSIVMTDISLEDLDVFRLFSALQAPELLENIWIQVAHWRTGNAGIREHLDTNRVSTRDFSLPNLRELHVRQYWFSFVPLVRDLLGRTGETKCLEKLTCCVEDLEGVSMVPYRRLRSLEVQHHLDSAEETVCAGVVADLLRCDVVFEQLHITDCNCKGHAKNRTRLFMRHFYSARGNVNLADPPRRAHLLDNKGCFSWAHHAHARLPMNNYGELRVVHIVFQQRGCAFPLTDLVRTSSAKDTLEELRIWCEFDIKPCADNEVTDIFWRRRRLRTLEFGCTSWMTKRSAMVRFAQNLGYSPQTSQLKQVVAEGCDGWTLDGHAKRDTIEFTRLAEK